MTLFVGALLILSSADAEGFRRSRRATKIVVKTTGDLAFTSSEADRIAGATYAKKYSNPILLGAGLGVLIRDNWYIGASAEYWLAKRHLDTGTAQEDTLRHLSLGAEAGIFQASQRLFLYLLGGVQYPLSLRVDSTAGTFRPAGRPLAFQAKALGGIYFSRYHAFYLQAGYRMTNLGNLTDGGTPYLPAGAELDLSGFFVGLGLLFEM